MKVKYQPEFVGYHHPQASEINENNHCIIADYSASRKLL